jgi:replicative DNA helicase
MSLEAEQLLIGSVLFENQRLDDCGEVRPEHFAEPAHGRVWAEVCRLIRGDRLAEPIAVNDALSGDAPYQELGGLHFLVECVDQTNPGAARAYADAVVSESKRRALLSVGELLREPAGDPDARLGEAERALAEIARDGGGRVAFRPIGATALDTLALARSGGLKGQPTGLAALDNVTGGIRDAEFWVLAGRASMGKSVVGLSLARGIAQNGRGVIVFSLEMTEREIQARMIADLAYDRTRPLNGAMNNPKYSDILKGKGDAQVWSDAERAAKRLASLPVVVTDIPGLTVDQIKLQAARQIRAWEKAGVRTGAVVVDHLGLIRPSKDRQGSTAAEVRDISNSLKDAAKELGVPLVALAQVNRQSESQGDRRPSMAQLNWSGSIEQDAHVVGLLYREAYYLERKDRTDEEDVIWRDKRFELELSLQKNRNGPLCNLRLFCDVASNVVRDLDERVAA